MHRYHCLFVAVAVLFALTAAPAFCAATLTRLSSTAAGLAANAESTSPVLSADGSVVVFSSTASNIGKQLPRKDLWKYRAQQWEPLTPTANGSSGPAAVSADGRYVYSLSQASNLTDSPQPPGMVYVFDSVTDKWTLVSKNAAGKPANKPCYGPRTGGGKLWFFSTATNLGHTGKTGGYQLYGYDPLTGKTTMPLLNAAGDAITQPFNGIDSSDDGRYLVVSTQGTFIPGADTRSHTWRGRLPGASGGVIQWQAADTGPKGMGNGPSYSAGISADGEWVSFTSAANNLSSIDKNTRWDVYRKNMRTGKLDLGSWNTSGVDPGAGNSWEPSISADGAAVAFSSSVSNLVAGHTNTTQEIFVVDWRTGEIKIDVPFPSSPANGPSSAPQISADGRTVVFASSASNLVAGDTNGVSDVYRWYRGGLPTVMTSSHTPRTAQQNCGRRTPVTFTFTENVKPASVSSRYKVQVGDVDWEGVLDWPTANRTARFTTKTPYPAGATVKVTLKSGIEKLSGGAFIRDEVWFFGVQTNPVVVSYDPKGNAVAVNSNISVTFDQAMDKASVQSAFKIQPSVSGVSSWSGNQLIFNPKVSLASDGNFIVTIEESAHALNANAGSLVPAGWHFHFGTAPSPVSAGLTLNSAATASGAVQITVNASTGRGDLTVEVLNLAGRIVATLPTRAITTGVSTLLWNRKSTGGTTVPPGQYLLRGTLRAAEGAQTAVLASVCLR